MSSATGTKFFLRVHAKEFSNLIHCRMSFSSLLSQFLQSLVLPCFPWTNLRRTQLDCTLQRLILQIKYVKWHLSLQTTPWDFQLSYSPRLFHTSPDHLPSLPRCLLDFCLCLWLCPFLETIRRPMTSLNTIVTVVAEFLLSQFWLLSVGHLSLFSFGRSFLKNINSNDCRNLTRLFWWFCYLHNSWAESQELQASFSYTCALDNS